MSLSKELFMQERERDSLLQSNKEERQEYAMAIINDVAAGNLDPMKILITAKKGIDIFKLIENNVRPYVSSIQIQKGGFELCNAKIIEKADATKYNFLACCDSEYESMLAEMDALKTKIENREAFLKTLQKPMVDPDTGEIINPPEITYGKMNVAVTLK